MNKINHSIAAILAEQIKTAVEKERKRFRNQNVKAARKSKEFAELKKIRAEISKLNGRANFLTEKLQDDYQGIYINGWGSDINIKPNNNPTPQVKYIKNKIIIANHITGVTPENVVAHVTKELLNEKF